MQQQKKYSICIFAKALCACLCCCPKINRGEKKHLSHLSIVIIKNCDLKCSVHSSDFLHSAHLTRPQHSVHC